MRIRIQLHNIDDETGNVYMLVSLLYKNFWYWGPASGEHLQYVAVTYQSGISYLQTALIYTDFFTATVD